MLKANRKFFGRFWPARLQKNFFRQSLTVKIVIMVSLVFCFVVAVATAAMMRVTRKAIAETSITTALYQTELLKMKFIETMLNENPHHEDLKALLENIKSQGQMDEVNIFNKNGEVRFSSSPANLGKTVPLNTGQDDRFTTDDALIRFDGMNQSGRLRIVHPIKGGMQCTACHQQLQPGDYVGGIELYVPLAPIYRRFSESRLYFVVIAIGLIAFGALLIRGLVHRMVRRPIKHLIHLMEKAQKGELGVRTPVGEDPDLKRLAKSFNSMVRGIQDAQERLRLQHQKELTQSNRLASLGLVISNVSHEIKNPLTAMSSALHVLRQDIEASGDKEIFQELTLQITRIQQTVNNLLRFAKQAPPRFETISILVPIRQAISLASYRLRENLIEVELHSRDAEPTVYADGGQMEQVFLNLFLNSASAMPNGGILTIEVQPVTESTKESPQDFFRRGYLIEVKDTGDGITPEDLPKIFEPFFTTKKGGTGIGLSVVRGIIQAHEGTIEAESVLGQGTTIALFIPAPMNQDPATGKMAALESQGGKFYEK